MESEAQKAAMAEIKELIKRIEGSTTEGTFYVLQYDVDKIEVIMNRG